MAKFRILEEKILEDGKRYIYAAGIKGDEKPVGDFVTGSMCLEYDDDNEKLIPYFYNETISDWGKA